MLYFWNKYINYTISGSSLFYTLDRFQVVDYLAKIGNNIVFKFVLKKPSKSYVENIYYVTFTSKVWVAALTILLIFACVIYVMLNWETRYKKEKKV